MEQDRVELEPTWDLACEMVLNEAKKYHTSDWAGRALREMHEKLVTYQLQHVLYIRAKCGTIK